MTMLLELPDDVFYRVVREDVRRGVFAATPLQRELRESSSPELVRRWRDVLAQMDQGALTVLTGIRGDNSEEAHVRRARTTRFRQAVSVRRQEAETLLRQLNLAANAPRARRAQSAQEQEKEAQSAAAERVCQAHAQEFLGYLREEYEARGLTPPTSPSA